MKKSKKTSATYLELISQTHNLLSSKPGLNQEGQYPTTLMLKYEIVK